MYTRSETVVPMRRATQCMLLAIIVGTVWAPLLNAEEMGSSKGKGRMSRGTESQKNSITTKEQDKTPMPGSDRSPTTSEAESPVVESRSMEEMMKADSSGGPTEQLPIAEVNKPSMTETRGGQIDPRPPAVARSMTSHLKLVLRVMDGGGAEVVSASEVQGDAAISDEPKSDFFYEVTDGKKSLAVEALPGDPFMAHGFGGPEGTPEGHFFERQKSAEIVVNVPGRNLGSALEKLNVQLYRLKPGVPTNKINLATVADLKKKDRLRSLAQARGAILAPQIRERAITIPADGASH